MLSETLAYRCPWVLLFMLQLPLDRYLPLPIQRKTCPEPWCGGSYWSISAEAML